MKDTIKNFLLVLVLFLSFSTIGKSQLAFGAGLTYLNDVGVQIRSVIPVDNFNLIPKVSYYIVDNVTSLSFEVDAAYNLLSVGDDNPIYLFAGPTLFRNSSSGFSNSNFGVNLGAGLQISHIYGELKYTTLFCDNCNGQIGASVGYMF